jgi:hypothetical protein
MKKRVRPQRGTKTATLRAGFAQADITPGPDVTLMGYGFRRPGYDAVQDRLRARACALVDGGGPAVLLSLDLVLVPSGYAQRLREAVAAELGVARARVIVAATHTHSGPDPAQDYLESLHERLVDTARRAAALTFPVCAAVAEAPLGLGYNRRVATPGGVRNCWGPQEWPERRPQPVPDPTCTVLVLRQTNGPRRYLVWNLGMHPVVLGKTSRVLSPDYPGRACERLAAMREGDRALFVLGAAGNVQPWMATQEDPAAVERVGDAAAAFVSVLGEAAVELREPGGKPPALRCAEGVLRAGRHQVDLCVWRLGAFCLAAAPVELFSELGLRLRRKIGGPVMPVTLANGCAGYWPTRAAFEEGGYEVDAAARHLKPGDGERLVNALARLAAG